MGFSAPNDSLRQNNKGNSMQPSAAAPQLAGTPPPDHRFNVANARMPQPPAPVTPGDGAVPISPWNEHGTPNLIAVPVPDTARPAK